MARRKHHRGGHRRRSNPTVYRRRRRSNPLGITGNLLKTSLWAAGGALATRALPNLALGAKNTGVVGYAANAGSAILLSWVTSMFDKSGSEGVLIGGLAATVLRIAQDNFGPRFALAGDPGGLGLYSKGFFAVPTGSDAYGRVLQSPYPQPALPAAAGGGRPAMGAARYSGRWRR
jgi:hypothetical protein